jgi:hypothetical protein
MSYELLVALGRSLSEEIFEYRGTTRFYQGLIKYMFNINTSGINFL